MEQRAGDGNGGVVRHSNRYAWYVVGLLMLAYTLSFIDRQILSLMVGPVRSDLNLSDTELSLLHGFAFAVFYTFMGIPIARIADSTSRTRLICYGITFWSVMTAVCGITKSFTQLFMARVGVGIGEATLNPAAYSLISDYFSRDKLGRAISVYGLGIYLGAGLAFMVGGQVVGWVETLGDLTLPVLGLIRSWQIAFWIVGLPGLLVVVVIALTVREPKRRGTLEKAAGDAVAKAGPPPFRAVLGFVGKRWRTFLPFLAGTSLISMLGYDFLAWTPETFIRKFGWSARDIGFYYGLIVLIFGTVGILGGGFIADAMVRRGKTDGYIRVVAWAGVGLVIPCALFPFIDNPWGLLALLIPINIFAAVPYGVLPAAIQAVTPNEMRAQVSAIYMFISNIIGLGFGPTLVALITDKWFGDDMALPFSIGIVTVIAAPLCAMLFFLACRPFRTNMEEAEAWAE